MGVYRTLSPEEYRDLEQRILLEDNHLLIFNKRTGEIVQGDKTGDEPLSETLKAFIAQRDGKPGQVFMGVPHRLDRPVAYWHCHDTEQCWLSQGNCHPEYGSWI